MSSNLDFVTPAELGRELGHNDGKHAGITVRRYLRMRYPDRPKGQRWRLNQEEANDVRLHFSAQPRTTSARRVVGAEEQMSTGAATMADSTDDRTKVAELIKKFRFAMFATRHTDGTLVAHPLTVQEAEFDGDLWFLVSKTSSPIRDLAADSHANVSLSSSDAWVSLSGTARLVEDRAKIEELWNPMVEAWFPEGPDDPAVGVLKFSADSAEYWDTPGGKIATAFSFVKSKITGDRYDGGESGKVDL